MKKNLKVVSKEEFIEMMNKQMKKLGAKGRDKITGIEGILTSKITYLYGCDQYGITIKDDSGKPETFWFDEGRIEIIDVGILPSEVKSEKNGADNREHPTGGLR